jgi:acyl-CoA reductase-like NAD-dependent aldehyde dehydrogenase
MPPFTPLFIDGQQVPASDNATFDVVNISTSAVVGTSASASSADCTAAVEAAGRAFKTWENTTPYAKRDLFLKAADLVNSDRWRELIVQTAIEETNCAPGWAISGWAGTAPLLRTVASFSNNLTGTTFVSSSVPGVMCEMVPSAMGVMSVF